MQGRIPFYVVSTGLILSFAASGCGARIDAARQKEAAELIFGVGGTVKLLDSDLKLTSMDELPEESFIIGSVDLNQTEVTDNHLKSLEGLTTVTYLGLHSTYVTDVGLDFIKDFKNLQEIELSYTPITDEALRKLAELPALKKVFIYDTAISDAGFEEFKKKRPNCLIVR
ncbi:MAG: hypothetical protein O2955_16400 [Planctomycetota bacterium]|nr:hypothetical protein [Planctomycetota bacterium]MDA1214094.1 hypothetical protein [Planctomycetota bacterium]